MVDGPRAAEALAIYRAAAPPEFFRDLRKASGQRAEGGVYSVELTTWMMMRQPLDPKATLSTAVQDVAQGRPQALLPTHKRLEEGTLSSNTGGYSRASPAADGPAVPLCRRQSSTLLAFRLTPQDAPMFCLCVYVHVWRSRAC